MERDYLGAEVITLRSARPKPSAFSLYLITDLLQFALSKSHSDSIRNLERAFPKTI